ncbi:alpha/beta hydrolase [Nocardia colli]|uniref:Alpha/beta hydrolase n=1 Tax=Nocardia colli TaxID=2545717 RepID=A0A5N0E7D5_9NOCA|nr:alpha/beta hydrolase [Nocardia colli]KAA8884064.1 alpha/beta hydrolase [Nocardia colli]
MKLATVFATAALAATALLTGCGTTDPKPADPGAYADINGLHMYYELHGTPTEQPPLVLLHGALSGITTDFGQLIPELAKTRRIIAIEQQAHAHTADIDRPLRTPQMAEDTVALLHQLGVQRADILGYSMGAGVALQISLTHPELVRKQILAAGGLDAGAMHPGLMDGLAELKPEQLHGTPFHNDYLTNAPRPEDFPRLVAKVTEHDQNASPVFRVEAVRQIKAPTLTVIGDSDIVRPEHAVEMFRLFGGGIMGDTPAGLPNAQLAILPGTSHITLVHRPELLLPMIPAFLDAPVRDAR